MIVQTDPEKFFVELHGKEQVAALRAKVCAPKETITSIRFVPVFEEWRKWQMRMPGTYAPQLLMAGSYWTEEGWDFIYAKRPKGFYKPRLENVLVVETTENKFRRIIVGCDEAKAQEIIAWWQNKS